MVDPQSSGGSGRRRLVAHALLLTALGGALLWLGVVSGFAADKTIATTGSIGSYNWAPETAEVNTNGSVEFKNEQSISHGVVFDSPPAAPSCSGLPSPGTGSGNWSGTCTFTVAGTYQFHCPIHPAEMTGTITVNGGGPVAPVVTTEPANPVKDTEATLNGKVNPSAQSTTYWFKYGTTATYDHETTHESLGFSDSSTHAKTANVTGLTAATTYHFRMFAENATGPSMGIDRSFTTAGPPTPTTEPATGVGGTEATLVGSINPGGLETKYFFNYGATAAYGKTTPERTLVAGTTPVSKTELVTGLSINTTYHFQLVAENSARKSEGIDKTFTTRGKPLATTGLASGVTDTAATLEGLVNAEGQNTNYSFKYGVTEAYGQETTPTVAGKGTTNVPASAPLTGLLPLTTYHFQLVAKSGAGESTGNDQTFTTSGTPPPPPPETTPPPPNTTPPPPTETPPPDTRISLKPGAQTKDRTPTFKFKSTVAGATFKCTLDGKALKPCRSPLTTKKLSFGRHTLKVSAVVGGVPDPTPALVSFKVVKPR
jgi:plastocyanin